MIRIVTDSAADLTAEQLSVPGIFVVPMSVTFADGTTQLDDGTMTKDEFFVRLAEDSKLPRTSQPSPASFMQVYEDAAAAGDEVLVITIGQKLSGTYQCAHLAAADVGLQVHIVDSEAASQAEALLVREAVRLRDEEGLTAEEIAAQLEMEPARVRELLQLAQEPVSLETPVGEEEDAHLEDFIQDEEAGVPVDEAGRELLRRELANVLKSLTPREERVLTLRFGLEDGQARTLEELGKEFNVTRERIRQIEAKALRKLRHPSRAKRLRDYLEE